jgi:hypothetical protein
MLRVTIPLLVLACASVTRADDVPVVTAPDAVDRVVSVQARIEPHPVTFAEPFALVVEIVRSRGLAITLPGSLPEKPALRRAGAVRRTVDDIQPPAGGAAPVSALVTERISIPFLALDTEKLETPAFTLTDARGETHEIPSLPVTLEDDAPSDAGVDETAFAAARTHHVYTVTDWRPLASLAVVGTGGAFFALTSFLLRRRRLFLPARPVEKAPVEKRPPADELALARLDALLGERLLARGEIPRFVERLMNEVLRAYLEERFAVPVSRETTREVAAELLRLSVPGLDLTLLRDILEAADLVKFARADVAAESAHEMAAKVRALVIATRAPREGVAP